MGPAEYAFIQRAEKECRSIEFLEMAPCPERAPWDRIGSLTILGLLNASESSYFSSLWEELADFTAASSKFFVL